MLRFAKAVAILCLSATTLCFSGAAQAQATWDNPEEAVFVMGGRFTSDYFSDALTVWDNAYEDNFFAGVGYQRFIYEYSDFKLGFEAGIGLRGGYRSSLEVWTGAVARLDMFQIGDISIVPSLTAGFSLVTDTIGVESERAARIGHNVPILYYLGPEIAIGHAAHPEYEGFLRLQHRSGGFGTIANIDGSNAVVAGFRYKF
ncbi:hypothetical protein [Devosia soli]|uniref:hypothetical protein n=1 Tax=Devosia soli TaxID=361041 RepID=UPI00069A9A04|nr:hypothetical protein [Devosia soli]